MADLPKVCDWGCKKNGSTPICTSIENGIHHRRDVSLGEDACRIAKRPAAHAMAALRNLAIGTYELQRDNGKTGAEGFKSWARQLTVSKALALFR